MDSWKDHPTEDLIQAKEEDPQGQAFQYQITYEPKRGALFIKVWFQDRVVTRFEKFGIHILNLQDRYLNESPLDPAHRLDPVHRLEPVHRHFIQHLLRFAHLDSWESTYVVPRKQAAYFLQRLSKFSEVKALHSQNLVAFSKSSLLPLLEFEGKNLNCIPLRLRFQKEEGGGLIPFSQTAVFPGSRPWVMIQGVFYPLRITELNRLLEQFDEQGFLLLTGDKAAEFLEKDLFILVERKMIDLPVGFQIPKVVRRSPEVKCQLSEDSRRDTLHLELHFAYGSSLLPPFEDETDFLVPVEEEGETLLIRRDVGFEKGILDRFYSQGFHRVGHSRFEIGEESGLDFVADQLPSLKSEGILEGEEKLRRFRVVENLGREGLRARAVSHGMDWFKVELKYQIEDQEIPFEIIQSLVHQGKKFLHLPGKGYAKILREEILSLENALGELGTDEEEKGAFRFRRFHAPYLDSLLSIDWSGEKNIEGALHLLRELNEIPNRDLPSSLQSVLRPYQHHGFDWLHFLYEHRFQGILADDMGLGKTVQALAFLLDLKLRHGPKPNLILAPTSVVFNWAAEAEKFTPELKVLRLTGADRKKDYDQIDSTDLVVTSYAIFRRDAVKLTERSWRTVVLDEAQYIKNYRSKTAGLVKELQAEQRLALTGTPLENRLSELWSIFDFLMPGFLGGIAHFQRRYQKPIEEAQDVETLERLKRRLFPFVMRRQKEEVAPELPPKTEIDQFCEMTPEQRRLYEQILAACRKRIFHEVEEKGIGRSQISILTALLRLRQACCHPELLGKEFRDREVDSGKFEMFKELLGEIVSEKHRVVVFSQFVEMLTLLRGWLDSETIVYEYLDGRTRKREERIKRFQNNPEIPVFLISLKAGGTGLNLSEADYVIHYDPWWNPAVQDQATDRVHRLGQTQHVFAYKLITKDSVEEKILALQGRKKDLFKGVLTADSALGKRLSYEDLEYLFS